MSKSKTSNSQTRPSMQYEARARGQFQHQSTVYRPVSKSKLAVILPDPRSCFYKRIMNQIKKLK